jgi:long-chain acyl-CoA synthetase
VQNKNVIAVREAGSLGGLLRERARRTPDALAFQQFIEASARWEDWTWAQAREQAARWQSALKRENLQPGDRVAVMLPNCREWAMYDIAALGLSLVVVPLFTEDRPDNAAYVLNDSGSKIVLFEGQEQWERLHTVLEQLPKVQRFVSLRRVADGEPRLKAVAEWLPQRGEDFQVADMPLTQLATIVYTSGTTGRPKGVMLSHGNILSNAHGGLETFAVIGPGDVFLSFLPLSHMLERTGGYYAAIMSGCAIAYARSVAQLAEDLASRKPTILISVPRIYERVYARINEQLAAGSPLKRKLFNLAVDVGWSRFEHSQGRGEWHPRHLLWPLLQALVASKIMARMGGRLRFALSGGAALAPDIARVFIGLGLPVLQGYGLTETSPVLCVSQQHDNIPASVGPALPGTELKIGANGELLARGPQVMLGYWNNPDATNAVLDADGWFHTGDQARIDPDGKVYITGRLKDVLVMANGEKVPPVDMELAIATDPLFEQVMLLGEGKSYLSVLCVLSQDVWTKVARQYNLREGPNSDAAEKVLVERVMQKLSAFPGYAKVRRVAVVAEPWSIDNGMLTPTMKVKRARVMQAHAGDVRRLYPNG